MCKICSKYLYTVEKSFHTCDFSLLLLLLSILNTLKSAFDLEKNKSCNHIYNLIHISFYNTYVFSILYK